MKRLLVSLVVAALTAAAYAVVPADFAKKFAVSVNESFTGTGADNVPVLLRLSEGSPTGFSYADVRNAGKDMLVLDANENELPFEIDTWDPEGESLVWVRFPRFEAKTSVTIYFGASSVNNEKSAQTWQNHVGVWHLNETNVTSAAHSYGEYKNSTATEGINGNLANKSIPNETGKIGKSFRVNDVTKAKSGNYNYGGVWVPGTDALKLGSTFAISGWFKMAATSFNYDHLFYKRKTSGNGINDLPNGAFIVEVGLSGQTTFKIDARGNSAGKVHQTVKASPFADWVYMTFVYDGGKCHIYANGAFVGDSTITAASDNDAPLTFGNRCTIADDGEMGDAAWAGWIDEVRLQDATPDATWIAAEYAAMAQSDVLTYDAVEDVDVTLPKVVDLGAFVNGNGTVTIRATMDDNLAAENTVKAVIEGNEYLMSTTDASVPAVYSVTIDSLTANRTYDYALRYASTGGTQRLQAAEDPFYLGAVSISKTQDADERTLSAGSFVVTRADAGSALTVTYDVSGTAVAGETYEALSGEVVIPAGATSATILVKPYFNAGVKQDTTVIATLVPGAYAVSDATKSATLTVKNSETLIVDSGEKLVEALASSPDGSFEFAADIDVAGLGYAAVPDFRGKLDGKGHVLTGLGSVPFCITNRGEIASLTIDGTVGDANTVRSVNGGGMFADRSYGGKFTDCRLRGYTIKHTTAKAGASNGGICGTAYDGSIFTRCMTDASCLMHQNDKSNNTQGGLVGAVVSQVGVGETAVLVACTNAATIKATGDFNASYGQGGLVGSFSGVSASIPQLRLTDCVNLGTFEVSGGNGIVGGLIGTTCGANDKNRTNHALIDHCVNNGTFQEASTAYNGGFVGQCMSASSLTIRNSVNMSDVVCATNYYAGGFVGYAATYMSSIGTGIVIENSLNCGSVVGKYAGGLIGGFSFNTGWNTGRVTLSNSASIGTITGTTSAGGLFATGVAGNGVPIKLDNCLMPGTVAYASSSPTPVSETGLVMMGADGYDAAAALKSLNDGADAAAASIGWSMLDDVPVPRLFVEDDAVDAVFFDWNGALLARKEIADDGTYETPADPVREGYVFKKWEPIVSPSCRVAKRAVYGAPTFTVTYDFANGAAPAVYEVARDQAAPIPEEPVRDGYEFKGWSKNLKLANGTFITGETTYTALWKSEKQPSAKRVKVLQWMVKTSDKTNRDQVVESITNAVVQCSPDFVLICGAENSTALTDDLSAALPGYGFVLRASNGSADAMCRLIGWRSDRYEVGEVASLMIQSNSTMAWLPARESGTDNYYLLMAGYHGTTKTTTDYINSMPSFFASRRTEYPTATFLLGANYENFTNATAAVYASTYESSPAKVLEAFETASGMTHLQAGDDFQWTFYQSAYDPIDVTEVQAEVVTHPINVRKGYVTSMKIGKSAGMAIIIR